MSGYLHFKQTGDTKIDAILGALNRAGNAYHNTSEWSEPLHSEDGNKSCSDLIQEAADAAAAPEDRSQISDGYHTFGELYRERSALTAALARMMQRWEDDQHGDDDRARLMAWVGRDATAGMDGFRTVLYIALPTGQVSWHFSDADAVEFLGGIRILSSYELTRQGNAFVYDGHDTPTKHARVEEFARG